MQFDWLAILEKIFNMAFIPLLDLAVVYLITWIHAKKQQLLEKSKDETTKKYIEMLDTTIVDCVLATNQTYVETLKKDGIFDAEAQKAAFQLTYNAVLDVLSDDAEEYLSRVIKDLPTYITNKIEAQVSLYKH